MDAYVPDGAVLTEFFWDRTRVSIIQGPIESGTSTACCHRIWALACEQEPDRDGVRRTRWIVLRKTYKQHRFSTLKTWQLWFPEETWGQMQHSEPAVHHLRKPLGDGTVVDCEVIFLAIENPATAEATLASFEITGAWINEAQLVDKEVMVELLSRTGRYPSQKNGPGATWHGVFCDMNAPEEGHWVPYMRGDIPIPPDLEEDDRQQYVKPDDWKFFIQPPGLLERRVDGQIVYEPNPLAENQKHIRVPYIKKIGGWDRLKIQRRIMNRIGLRRDGKPVYPTFAPDEHIALKPIAVLPGTAIIVGLDFGRMPAACFCQCAGAQWRVLSELIGSDESAELFAPRVKRHLAQMYPGLPVELWGDPRGKDGNQNVEATAYDIYRAKGMMVLEASSDNNPTLRRAAVEAVLNRRNGLLVDPSCRILKQGLAGSYHFRKMPGVGVTSPKPVKNLFSHIVEAFENAILGGGEGDTIITPANRPKQAAHAIHRHRARLRSAA